MALIREVHYLQQLQHENIPPLALQLYGREAEFRGYTTKLNQVIDWYNSIRRMYLRVEYDLVKDVVSIACKWSLSKLELARRYTNLVVISNYFLQVIFEPNFEDNLTI